MGEESAKVSPGRHTGLLAWMRSWLQICVGGVSADPRQAFAGRGVQMKAEKHLEVGGRGESCRVPVAALGGGGGKKKTGTWLSRLKCGKKDGGKLQARLLCPSSQPPSRLAR